MASTTAAAASIALLLFVSSIMVCSSAPAAAARGPSSAAPAPTPTAGGGGGGPAPSPSPGGMGCDDALSNASACLTYVEDGSNLTAPEAGCCPALASLVDNQPTCLCQLLASSEIFSIPINNSKALKLPAACRVQTPGPVSLCAAIGIPVASPPESMSPAPASGGPAEPGTASATPVAAPPSHSAAGTNSGADGVLAAGALFLVATMFFWAA